MEGKVHHLQKCLDGIYKVIRSANDILCGISQPSVCSEVLQSPQGVAYISGVNEVYKVAKRVEGGMKSLNIDNQNLHNRLRDIELTWNNLQAFFSFSPTILQMLSSELTPDCSPATDSENGQITTCGVCLFRTGDELNASINNSDRLFVAALKHGTVLNLNGHRARQIPCFTTVVTITPAVLTSG